MKDKLLQVGINTYKRLARVYTPLPRQIKIEVTRACNLRCAGCRRIFPESIANAPGPTHLTVDILEAVTEGLPIKVVRFTGDGEPLCNPYLRDLLTSLKIRGIRSMITTNATLLDRVWIRLLEDLGVFRVSVSFDGATKETFESLRGGADFDQVYEACQLLGQSRMQLYMNCLLSTDEVIEQLPSYLSMALEMGATGIHLMKFQSQEEGIWTPPDLSKHKGVLEWVGTKAKQVGLEVSAQYTTGPTFRECEDPYIAPWITLTGDVFPCVYMANMREYELYQGERMPVPWRNYVMGNLLGGTQAGDIWKNEAYKDLRRVLKATRKPNGYTTSTEAVLEVKKDMAYNPERERFSFCNACLCRWGESGL